MPEAAETLRLIVGLGNPGSRYARTRHNVGFMLVDKLAPGAAFREKFHGLIAEELLFGDRLLLLKPTTYMNLSGRSVRAAATFYKIPPAAVLVVHDEIDLPFGTVRLKLGGGEAGNRGLRSITAELGTAGYARLRIGIGRPPPDFRGDPADFVLQAFAPGEQAELDGVLDKALGAVELTVRRGLAAAMNATNQRQS